MEKAVQKDIGTLVEEWIESDWLRRGDIFVIGCSTSEIAGQSIGSSGSESLAEILFYELQRLKEETGVHLAFQCCEHLNRSLVVEKQLVKDYGLTEVSVLPTKDAGGSMASYAYHHMQEAILVEKVQAHAGIDIGQTMIGMHLKPVAVPIRMKQKQIHRALITCARTRPKLIGGSRASYE